MTTTSKWFAGFNILLGLWLITAPRLFSVPTPVMLNAIVVGFAIAVLGGYNYYLTTKDEEVNATVAAINTLLGLWVIAAPFVFNPGTSALWNDLIVGIMVVIFAGYNAYQAGISTKSSSQRVDAST